MAVAVVRKAAVVGVLVPANSKKVADMFVPVPVKADLIFVAITTNI